MLRIVLKNFRYHIKSYIIFFWSIVFSVAMLFSFMYLREIVGRIQFYQIFVHSTFGGLKEMMGKVTPLVMLISAIVIIYALKYYIRTRMRDYGNE